MHTPHPAMTPMTCPTYKQAISRAWAYGRHSSLKPAGQQGTAERERAFLRAAGLCELLCHGISAAKVMAVHSIENSEEISMSPKSEQASPEL